MRAFRPLIVVVIQTTSPRGGDDQPASLSHSTGRHLHHVYAHENYPPVAFCLHSTFRATPTRKTCDFAMRNPEPLISKGPTRYHNPGTPPMLMISCPSTPSLRLPKPPTAENGELTDLQARAAVHAPGSWMVSRSPCRRCLSANLDACAQRSHENARR